MSNNKLYKLKLLKIIVLYDNYNNTVPEVHSRLVEFLLQLIQFDCPISGCSSPVLHLLHGFIPFRYTPH